MKKEAEKILKCKDLTMKIQRMWNVKARVIMVKTGVTGTITKSLRQYMSNKQTDKARN
jgi:RNase P/RNase MRP subunit POP5